MEFAGLFLLTCHLIATYWQQYSNRFQIVMALYYDAASVLSADRNQGSLKSRIYGTSTLKSKPTQVYALISESAKRDVFLKEVLDNAQLLQKEPKVSNRNKGMLSFVAD